MALLLGTGITAAELSALSVGDLDTEGSRASVFVRKRGPRIARRVPVDGFAVEILREYAKACAPLRASDDLLFMATAGGKPMKPATLGQCVRAALRAAGATAADESPGCCATPMAAGIFSEARPTSRSVTSWACPATGRQRGCAKPSLTLTGRTMSRGSTSQETPPRYSALAASP
ncbi:tyrosine-type recombinase/integrase [Paraburkholderia kirstenboschensis]|uniref:Tyrosine-type recombinase/integrase n=1 Tax=Paraburkholderia kirstenboschensis TaxID=1245436 RepID=A0ABZ0EAC9_9BURK|nr:tyrosine-type recombinase/integrase [Paraburkholderia kirstenboschensis]WOD13920.1 tyrosine-type recombinase/integrase [Paraburkholderia kirstenboschensis]